MAGMECFDLSGQEHLHTREQQTKAATLNFMDRVGGRVDSQGKMSVHIRRKRNECWAGKISSRPLQGEQEPQVMGHMHSGPFECPLPHTLG